MCFASAASASSPTPKSARSPNTLRGSGRRCGTRRDHFGVHAADRLRRWVLHRQCREGCGWRAGAARPGQGAGPGSGGGPDRLHSARHRDRGPARACRAGGSRNVSATGERRAAHSRSHESRRPTAARLRPDAAARPAAPPSCALQPGPELGARESPGGTSGDRRGGSDRGWFAPLFPGSPRRRRAHPRLTQGLERRDIPVIVCAPCARCVLGG